MFSILFGTMIIIELGVGWNHQPARLACLFCHMPVASKLPSRHFHQKREAFLTATTASHPHLEVYYAVTCIKTAWVCTCVRFNDGFLFWVVTDPLQSVVPTVATTKFIDVLLVFLPCIYIYIHTVTTFEYVEGGPDREAPKGVWNTSSYI